MLISPQSIRIQTQNTNQGNATTHPFGRVSFGHYANFNSSYQFGTLAHLYKYDVLTSYEQSMQPTMLIETITQYGAGIALKTNGAIVSQGALCELGQFIQTDSSSMTVINLIPFNGSVYIIKNSVANKPAYIPAISSVRYALGVKPGTAFTYRIKIISMRGNAAITLNAPSDGSATVYNGNNAISTYTINGNTIHELTLISDGSTHYWKIKNVT